jgi:hypothetical protein
MQNEEGYAKNETSSENAAAKEKIAGWLIAVAVVLWFNLLLAMKIFLDALNRPANTRIIYPALFVDIAITCGCIWLLRLLHRRDPRFPGHYAAYNLLVYAMWTLAILLANVGAHMQWIAIGLQNLFLTPYVLRSKRVERTFPPFQAGTAPGSGCAAGRRGAMS